MTQYPVVSTGNEIWAVNPENKNKIKLSHVKQGILDLYTCDRAIYHASETISSDSKYVKTGHGRLPRDFDFNYVSIYDSLKGKIVKTVYPEGQRDLPLEKRMFELDFSFMNEDGTLKYMMNGTEGVLFESICSPAAPSDLLRHDGDRIYFDGRRIAKFGKDILHFGVVDSKEFERMLRKKNDNLHKKFKNAF